MYNPSEFGDKEVDMMRKFDLQVDDAKSYFLSVIRPRLDRSYKLYIADNSDRSKEIKRWQANIAVPYIHAVVETLKPRILDARPDFSVQGRNEDDQLKASRLQNLCDYTWEIDEGDKTAELLTSSALIYGTAFLQVSWKRDVRTYKFLSTKDISSKKMKWVEKEQVYYDAPHVEWVDNYNLWYDWHNVSRESKQYWFKRLILTGAEIKRKYPSADPKRLEMALARPGGELEDYGSIRNEVKIAHEKITKGDDYRKGAALTTNIYQTQNDPDLKMYEVYEWLRPYEDAYAVVVNRVPILKGGYIPNPYNFKETFFIEIPYLRVPGEFEGYGIPLLLENPQIMLNMIKNQRLDATTLNIHKMWMVNPLANIKKEELVTRPFGIIYSPDPNGAREIQFSDVKSSAYREEELLKSDMRYGSGVDDFSMGTGGGTPSATEVRHLRESTLERVRLFVNHLSEAYSKVMRYWISMYGQFYTDKMVIRITGENGATNFPVIEKDDLMGEFDFKASVISSIAGQNDIKRKQDMDLFQLLVNMPFIDPQKLTSKLLYDWSWNIESLKKSEEPAPPGMEGLPPGTSPEGMPPEGMPPEGMPPEMAGMAGAGEGMPTSRNISPEVMNSVMAMLGGGASPMAELKSPVNLLGTNAPPPTPRGIPAQQTTNPRGFNRPHGGRVNTNIPLKQNANIESALMNRTFNLQR